MMRLFGTCGELGGKLARSDYFTDYFIANSMLLKWRGIVKYFLASEWEIRAGESLSRAFYHRYCEKLTTVDPPSASTCSLSNRFSPTPVMTSDLNGISPRIDVIVTRRPAPAFS